MATDLTQLLANPEISGFERQRKMAQLLMQQGMQTPQSQMVGNVFVGASPWQFLGNLAQQYVGQKELEDIDKKELEYAKALREKRNIGVQDIMDTLSGNPEKVTELAGPAYNGITPQAVLPAQAPNPQLALSKALRDETGAGNLLIPSLVENVIPKKTQDILNWEAAKAAGYKGDFNQFRNQMTDAEKARIGIAYEQLALDKAKAANELANGKPLTEFQGKATNFGVQMAGSMKEMKAVEDSGFDPASTKNQALLSIAGTSVGNMFVSPEAQRYKQAMDNFTENYIRFKSGANVPMHEIEKDLKNMMPQTGDKPDKLAQKQRARERALEGMAISAGPGMRHISQEYNIEAPGMTGKSTPKASSSASPSAWGQATIVEK